MSTEAEYPGQGPCPACFESSGYIWEHGNDWDSGPWSHQTNIPCRHCNGSGTVNSPLATLDDLENEAAEESDAGWNPDIRNCSMGVGCDEAGICYADAHDQPERCPSHPRSHP